MTIDARSALFQLCYDLYIIIMSCLQGSHSTVDNIRGFIESFSVGPLHWAKVDPKGNSNKYTSDH